VFGRWSIGRNPELDFRAPAGGLTITLLYTRLVESTIAPAIPAANRNADWYAPLGQAFGNLYDPNALCSGRDSGGVYQMGLEFALDVPRGTRITSAVLEFLPTADQAGSPLLSVRAYDVASAPVFVSGSPLALTAHAPLGGGSISWSPAAFTPGVPSSSPDLRALVQAVVDRPDWLPGGFLGLVLDGTPSSADSWRCVANFAAGTPPILRVTYGLPVKIRPETGAPGTR
jgi:hypothetical protein